VAAAFYYLRLRWRRASLPEFENVPYHIGYPYAASTLLALLLGQEIPNAYLALAFLFSGLLLVEAGAWLGDIHFRLPAYGLLLAGTACSFRFNLQARHQLPLAGVCAAGLLYLVFRLRSWIRRRVVGNEEEMVATSYTYLSAALVAALVFCEADTWWVAPGLALLALLFAAPGLLLNLVDFRRSSALLHLLSVLTAFVRLPADPGRNWWLTERAWGTLTVVLLTYLLSYWIHRRRGSVTPLELLWRMVQCWMGTGLLSLLVWYDVRPVGVAVAWGLLGLALAETGSLTRSLHLRCQGYLLSASAFCRIFFSNLDATTPVAGLSTRFWTVGLLILVFYYQFLRLRSDRRSTILDPRENSIPEAYSYLGLASLAALIRFEITRPWIAVVWALLGAVVLALGLYRSDRQFRLQAYLLGFLVAFRTSLNNFYLLETYAGLSARLVTIAAVVAILFGCFFLTQMVKPSRHDEDARPHAGRIATTLRWVDRYSRYVYFFAPAALLTVLLAIEVRAGLLTLAWGLEGLGLFLCGLIIAERPFRLTGLFLLVICIGRIFVIDLHASNMLYRIASFLVLGAVLLVVSFLYTRYRQKLNRYL